MISTFERPKTKKIPYDPKTGKLLIWETYFDDIPDECDGDFIEMSREDYTSKVYMGTPNMHYPVCKNGEIRYEFDEKFRDIYEGAKKADEMVKLEEYLNETDYVVIKMYEASLDGEDLAPFKEKYAGVLKKRQEVKEKLNAYKENIK